ncbi:hypothetical protein MLD38_011348 [Melastoma candidum]|uniref:Uncharacterized protein n=1 Tax=Melastoma candidum TaxID=119954 RepID=A0ACB9R2S9_9MYRT|nr:hypothetical protein MLD38_011348 [Melastoma candidum]
MGRDQFLRQETTPKREERRGFGCGTIRPAESEPGGNRRGMRGVRRVADAMQTETVRAAMGMQHRQRRKRGAAAIAALAESVVMGRLVGNEFLAKNVELVVSTDEAIGVTVIFPD